MHGAVLAELQKFVAQSYGALGAELAARIYMPIASYPDADADALLEAAVRHSGKSADDVLIAFGEHLAPRLLDTYRDLLRPSWGTLDVLENTESTIHRIVRIREPGAAPPRLVCSRIGERQLEIAYASARRLCALAVGLARGVARAYGDTLEVSHRECAKDGAERCVLDVRLLARPAAPGPKPAR
jgi:hypothetical protein